jgi:hypothetical protein
MVIHRRLSKAVRTLCSDRFVATQSLILATWADSRL